MLTDKDREKLAKLGQKRALRTRIDLTCKECCYDDKAPGTWRKQVMECTITGCPLHPVRPTSKYYET